MRHYAIRTEAAYVDWARRFILFHGKRHPAAMGVAEVNALLSHLAVERDVSPATQAQAKAALLFLYREVLGVRLRWLDEVVAAKGSQRLLVVVTPSEVAAHPFDRSTSGIVRRHCESATLAETKAAQVRIGTNSSRLRRSLFVYSAG